MTLDELLAMEEIEDVNTWRADVSAGVNDLSAGFQARLAELEENVKELETKYQETAARNYELMIAATDAPKDDDEGVPEENPQAAIDDLFKED